jgi:hypothetical protein
MLFAPASGQEIMAQLKRGWQATLTEARNANAERRAELEADLARRQGKTPPQLPVSSEPKAGKRLAAAR